MLFPWVLIHCCLLLRLCLYHHIWDRQQHVSQWQMWLMLWISLYNIYSNYLLRMFLTCTSWETKNCLKGSIAAKILCIWQDAFCIRHCSEWIIWEKQMSRQKCVILELAAVAPALTPLFWITAKSGLAMAGQSCCRFANVSEKSNRVYLLCPFNGMCLHH